MIGWFARIRDALARSLALRWVLYVTAAAGFGIAALLIVTSREMEYQLEAQGATVRELGKQKTAERIDAEIKLVEHRLNSLFQTLGNNLTSVATQRASQVAVLSGNDVVIAQEIGQRLVENGFTGAIVLNKSGSVIGAERNGSELVSANLALKLHELYPSYRELLDDTDPAIHKMHRFIGTFDAALGSMLLANTSSGYGIVLATPVYDEFSDPIGLIVAYRLLMQSEPALTAFAGITDAKIALLAQDRIISVAGATIDQINLQSDGASGTSGLIPVPELKASARCQPSLPGLMVCVMRANAEIDRFSEDIMQIGHEQFAKTQNTLISIGGASLALIMGLLVVLGRRLTRPLSEIAQAVDRVARGEWRVEVMHTERADEIGRIARAVSSMQASLAERDRMRQEMVRIDAINQRRMVLDHAVARFEDGMAVVVKNIADTVRTLAVTNDALDRAARRAGDQAETIRLTSVATASRTTVASRTTLELGKTMQQIGRRVLTTREVVHESEVHALAAQSKLGEVAGAAQQAEDAIASLQGLVADLAHLSLRASLEAVQASEDSSAYSPIAQSVSALAVKLGQATSFVTRELGRLGAIADSASDDIGEVKGVLGKALRETAEISVAVEEQDAATREISEGLTNSASALIQLADAVDQLRESMATAHEASADFVVSARRITDDAKSIDSSIRSFIREVVA